MNEIKNLLINYWQLILSVVIFILSFILQLFKKKPVEVVSSVMEIIYKKVPEMVSWYEKFYGAGKGNDKKKSVITSVLAEIERCYALNDNQRAFYKYAISNYIEDILSTPQKKGGNTDAK